jgi:hypothetical protein
MRFLANENATATLLILLRLKGSDRDTDNRRILEALEGRTDWAGHFSVVTDDRIRMRPLPSVPPAPEGA